MDRKAELKAVCQDEPNLRATLADLDAELAPLQVRIESLLNKRCDVMSKLNAVASAKDQLADMARVPYPPIEPQPAPESFAVPATLEPESAKEEDHG